MRNLFVVVFLVCFFLGKFFFLANWHIIAYFLFGNGLCSLCIFGLIIDWRYRRSYNSRCCNRIYRIVWKNAIEAWKCSADGYSWSISGLDTGNSYPIRSDGATLFSGKWQLTSHTVYRGIIGSVMIGSYHVISGDCRRTWKSIKVWVKYFFFVNVLKYIKVNEILIRSYLRLYYCYGTQLTWEAIQLPLICQLTNI